MVESQELFRRLRAGFPMLEKTLRTYQRELESQPGYETRSGYLIRHTGRLAEKLGLTRDDLDDAFADFCIEFLKEQAQFIETQAYSAAAKGFREVVETIYNDSDYMRSYMLGYLLSCALFPHHYRQFRYFEEQFLPSLTPRSGWSCECGVGHGLYLGRLLETQPGVVGLGMDISPECVTIAGLTMDILGVPAERYHLQLGDVTRHFRETEQKYDAVIASGLIEHLEHPAEFLQDVARALVPETGRLFTMAPTNTPHPDHLYHFRDVEEIRALFAQADLHCRDDLVVRMPELPDVHTGGVLQPEVYLRISSTAG
ncbi:MAG: class I SAM-dependent methyltransferase [Phycisphaerae bacterium]|nr:class I SAM-dependent methyltransferase [Phycisphaerae bacterium]